MGTLFLIVLLGSAHGVGVAQFSGHMLWEEKPVVQKFEGYTPKLRYYGGSEFKFESPYYIIEGHFSVTNDHYTFRPETAINLNHADVDKLVAEMDPESRRVKQENYAKSLQPFEAQYDETTGTLLLEYTVGNMAKRFSLYEYTDGDAARTSTVNAAEGGVVGLWCQPDPYPDKLDSKTRYRIEGLDGLKRFSKEASLSDMSQFNVIDLRVDRTFRKTSKEGTWRREGERVI